MRCSYYSGVYIVLPAMGLILTLFSPGADACAVCVSGSAEDQGYFWGVLFLMSMPFTVGSLIGGWLLYHYHRAQARHPRPASTSALDRGQPLLAPKSPVPGRCQTDAQADHALILGTTADRWSSPEKESTR
jgi:hypothetical protein